jgi:hypothetical protein
MSPQDDPAEVLNPQQYGVTQRAEIGYRLVSLEVTVQLLPDPRRARYTNRVVLQTTGDEPASCWRHDIAALGGEVTNVQAQDGHGGLAYLFPPNGGHGSKLEIALRRTVRQGEQYVFSYTYETRINSVVAPGVFSQTITYGDWLMPNLACEQFTVKVLLPTRAEHLVSVPSPAEAEASVVRYERTSLRPLETVGYLVAYRKRKMGLRFWQWIGNLLIAGLVGAFIAEGVRIWL